MNEKFIEYRFYINSENIPNQKSHNLFIQLNREFSNCVDIKLVNVSLCNSFYNISNILGNNYIKIHETELDKWYHIYFNDGLYNFKSIEKIVNQKLPNNLNMKIIENKDNGILLLKTQKKYSIIFDEIPGEVWGMRNSFMLHQNDIINNTKGIKPPKLLRFSHFYIHCDLIDRTKNFEIHRKNIKPSNILCSLPVKNVKEFGTQINYNLVDNDYKMIVSQFNSLELSVRDHNGKLIDLNNFPVTYEIVIRCKNSV